MSIEKKRDVYEAFGAPDAFRHRCPGQPCSTGTGPGPLAPSRGATPQSTTKFGLNRNDCCSWDTRSRVVPPSLPRQANCDVRAAFRPVRQVAQDQPARRAGHPRRRTAPPFARGRTTNHFLLRYQHEHSKNHHRWNASAADAATGPVRRGTQATGSGGSPVSWDSNLSPEPRPRPRWLAPSAPRPREHELNDQVVSLLDADRGHPRCRRALARARGRSPHTLEAKANFTRHCDADIGVPRNSTDDDETHTYQLRDGGNHTWQPIFPGDSRDHDSSA